MADDVLMERYGDGDGYSFRATHRPTGLVASASTAGAAMDELKRLVYGAVEAVSVYDQRSVSGKPPEGTTMTLNGETMTMGRVVVIYRRSLGEPWEFGLVKLVGMIHGEKDIAILIRSDDWPEWLTRFVDGSMPKDEPAQYRELLTCIWLYVNWRYVTTQLTTEQRELWADAIDATREPYDEEPYKVERWWQ